MKRILIIEDDPHYAALLSQFLPGCERFTVSTLADAKVHLAANRFDIVFADLNLPDSGPERTLAEINLRARDAAVIAMSGRSEAMPYNCDAAFHKVNAQSPDDILRIIQIALKNKKKECRIEKATNSLLSLARALKCPA